jgi:hypothetical protein
VRINMPEDEYDLNGNFGREDRNSGCSAARYAGQVPIITG